MNCYHTAINILLSSWLCCSCIAADYPEVERARLSGAQGRVTLRITDSAAMPVEDAKTSVAFWASDSLPDVISRDGTTDTNGYYVATGITMDRMGYLIEKDGYYSTHGELSFYRPGEDCVDNGRWQPWNHTNTIVLKKRRNPVSMIASSFDIPFPIRDKAVGLDMEVGDWVKPYGEGSVSDIMFSYSSHLSDDILVFSNRLGISFQGQGNGYIRKAKDSWSEYVFVYDAPLMGYIQEMVLSVDRTRFKILKRNLFGPEEYLIFRIRSVLDEKGEIVSARYGIIDGPIKYGDDEQGGGVVQFRYWLNPASVGRNLEHY